MSKKNLCLFTNTYPYGAGGESFLEYELELHAQHFEQIFLFPLNPSGRQHFELPKNVQVVDLFTPKLVSTRISGKGRKFISIFFDEVVLSNQWKGILRFRYLFQYLQQRFDLAERLVTYLKESGLRSNSVFYSFWTDEWATVLCILKQEGQIDRVVTRMHGYDLYPSRWKFGVIPFRYFQLKNIDRVLTVSTAGLDFLKETYSKRASMFYWNPLVVRAYGLGPFDPKQPVTIVSCSSVIPLKRVELIVDALQKVDVKLRWIHFGSGVGFPGLQKRIASLPTDISVDLRGHVPHDKIIEFYQTNSVNLFIGLSLTEGLPISFQEAASFGIPMIGTNAGGTHEIVDVHSGILLPLDVSAVEVSRAIQTVLNGEMNTSSFHGSVRAHWTNKFNKDKLYQQLNDLLIGG